MGYALFLDESYGRDHFYVAGVLVDEAQARKLESGLDGLAVRLQRRNQWEELPEFHGHSLMNGLDDWKELRPYFGVRLSVYMDVLRVVRASGARVFIQGVDVQRLNARYMYPPPPFEVALSRLLSVVDEWCALVGARCSVVADERGEYARVERLDTRFMWRNPRPLRMIREDISFTESRGSYGVQAADMCAYIARRFWEQDTDGVQVKRSKRRLYRMVEPCVEYMDKWLP